MDFNLIRASFGTTKYCSFFLRNLVCNNSECMYLHDLGSEEDIFSKEDISQGYFFLIFDHPNYSFRIETLTYFYQENIIYKNSINKISTL